MRALCAAVAVGLAAALAGAVAAGAGAAHRTFGSGGWSWFADPRAVYAGGRVYAGWVDRHRHVVVGAVGRHSTARVRIGRQGSVDDHGNPALLVDPDGRITAYYSDHNGRSMHWRTTRRPLDISAWGRQHSLPDNTYGREGFTYPNPVRLAAERRTYLFWRGANWGIAFARKEWLHGWSQARTLFSRPGQRPYLKVASNDRDEIDLAFTNGHPREIITNIYYARYRRGVLYRADGSRIGPVGSAPFRPSRADKVYDARRHGARAWIHDVAVGPDGHPRLVYATFRQGRHRYEYARYDGTRWEHHPLGDAGGPITASRFERFYSGGVVLDHRRPSVVYASVERRGHHEIERLVTPDGGRHWRRRSITHGSSTDNVRPVVPRDLPSGQDRVLWMRGRYIYWTDFETTIVGSHRR